MIKISDWHDIALLGINVVSLLATFYTIALIIWITPKSMSEYRWFLMLYTTADAGFIILYGLIIFPKILPPSPSCIVQGLGRDIFFLVEKYFGEEGGNFIVRLGFLGMIWQVVNIFATQDYCLIYRFTIVHPNQKYHDILVNKKVVCCAVLIANLLCYVFTVPCFKTIPSTKETRMLMKIHEKLHPGVFDDVEVDSIVIWLREDSEGISWLFGLILGGFIISEIVAISSVSLILRILRQNAASFSAQTYSLHRQMTVLLIFQIINPLIFIIFPVVSCTFVVIYKVELNKMTTVYGTIFMSFYSISNTILTVGFVTPYRHFTAKYTYQMLLKLPFLKKYQAVAPIPIMLSTSGHANI